MVQLFMILWKTNMATMHSNLTEQAESTEYQKIQMSQKLFTIIK